MALKMIVRFCYTSSVKEGIRMDIINMIERKFVVPFVPQLAIWTFAGVGGLSTVGETVAALFEVKMPLGVKSVNSRLRNDM